MVADPLTWAPARWYHSWHDRAVFHFLLNQADRGRYVATARRAVTLGGALVPGTFAPDGPTSCSGLAAARYNAAGLAQQFAPDFVLEHSETEQHAPRPAPSSPYVGRAAPGRLTADRRAGAGGRPYGREPARVARPPPGEGTPTAQEVPRRAGHG